MAEHALKVAVIGAGSWGTTVANLCARNAPTKLYSRREEAATAINERHENPRYLPGFALHPALRASNDLEEVVSHADVLVMGVASNGFRSTLQELRPFLRPWVPVVSLTKGLEVGTKKRMTEIVGEELPGHPAGALTGPNLAKEILAGFAAASVLAFCDPVIGARVQPLLASRLFRVYQNEDLVGCEVAGALKNVIAIAAGMADGLQAGDNTRAMVITRGLAEISRLGVAMGGQAVTFSGLAGMGDLLATCMSPQSRNRFVGEELGRGKTVKQITTEMDQIAEGVKSAPIVMELAAEYGVEMPICSQIRACVVEGRTATQAYFGLVRAPATHESAPD